MCYNQLSIVANSYINIINYSKKKRKYIKKNFRQVSF